MNRNTRYWVRRILFLVLLGLIGYALYQTVAQDKKNLVEAGEKAPNFELSTLDGKTVKLSDFKGRVILLNFWGTWCEPCRTEMPALQKAYENYHKEDFVVLAVNIAETDVAVSSFADQYGLTFPVLLDRNRDVTRLYQVGPIPSTFFIDKDGKISNKVEGPLHLGQLHQYILPML
ncbi:thiol-disulfide oxidoreductase ResA [Thermoactinomyces mirandus]|uniref:Thiol-disulfide oxidoreductase ResA n=1 Tax=Thermoactinomyces mirandus TaxID=2756294 RepID=A0A7W1XQ97_9BACL|nr:thiol-disulfide oxidoreductase ResA [Thermoactinomyces mirandus]MBA4601187.1 thiol-disulfide oxidoreductase ResA [Thermoactinomyces mirandus]